jgi:branched-chain amino acid transport system substrate-binding protein
MKSDIKRKFILKSAIWSWGLICLVFASSAAVCEIKPFQLGVAVCLKGGCAEWGTSALRGVKLAVSEINKEGGILGRQVTLVYEDTAEAVSGVKAVKAFQRLLGRDDLQYIIGPSWSPAGLALIPILKRRQDVIAITPSMAVTDFARAADNLFKTVPDNATTAEHIAEYAIKQGLRRCAILSNQLKAEQYTSEVFTKKYESLGGRVVRLVETAPEETDLRTHALKIIQSKPDVVFLAHYVHVGSGAKRLRELKYKGPFISILLDRTRLQEGGTALEGTVFSKYVSYSAEFDKKYRDKYGEAYGPSADSAYDTVYLLREAIKKGNTFDSQIIKKVLPTVKMKGTATMMEFNKYRTVQKPPLLFVVKNGEARPL